MWFDSIGYSRRLLWGLAFLGAVCSMSCTQDPKENARAGVAAAPVDAAQALYRVDAEPVVQGEIERVAIRAMMPAQRVALDEPAKVELSIQIAPGYHIYEDVPEESAFTPLRIECRPACGGAQEFVEPQLPNPTEVSGGSPVYRGSLAVSIPARICAGEGDQFVITILVQYQACNDLACFPPEKVELNLPVNIRLNEARRHP